MAGSMGCVALCYACSIMSFIGAAFYAIAAVMVRRNNKVFLSVHAQQKWFDPVPEDADALFTSLMYCIIVSFEIHKFILFLDFLRLVLVLWRYWNVLQI
jgi:hypothetical protein